MNFLTITQFNVDLLILGGGAAASALLGTLTYFNNPKSATNTAFFLFSLVTILWATSNFFEYQFDSIDTVLFTLRLHLFISVWHAYLFFRLCYVFPKAEVRFPARAGLHHLDNGPDERAGREVLARGYSSGSF